MNTKKDYIDVVRWYNLIDSFITYYFIRIIVVYLLVQGVISWAAVLIPIVFEFASLVSRGFKKIIKFSVKVDIKKFYLLYIFIFAFCAIIISFLKNYFLIYLLVLIMGFLKGTKNSVFTRVCTSNSEYEAACLLEEERSNVIGGTFGLIVSQIVYDISPSLYVISFIFLIFIGFAIINKLPVILEKDCMMEVNNKQIKIKDCKNLVVMTFLYSIL